MKFFQIFSTCLAWLLIGATASTLDSRAAGNLTQVTDFGSNPSGTLMYIYVPQNLAAKPAVIVAIHYCSGTAAAYYTGSPYASLAETYGFIVIYPQSPYSGTCWDVSSTSALTHNGGGDSNSIANMVTYVLSTYGADASRVYVTGSSSGAMMTNVLAATYPEMFAAAIVYSGVPAGCFVIAGAPDYVDGWNSSCADGDVDATQQQWASIAENMYPGYTGSRPKMQIYHGSVDTTLWPPNYNETIKQWTGVFGYSLSSYTLQSNYPLTNYYTYTYGPEVQGIYAIGVGHTVPINGAQDMAWFGFTNTTSSSSTTTAKPTSTTTVSTSTKLTTTSANPTSSAVAQYGQCGGLTYTGSTTCAAGYTCTFFNSYYSQCL